MHSHPLARLTPISREHLIRQHIEQGIPLFELAGQPGTSEQKPAATPPHCLQVAGALP